MYCRTFSKLRDISRIAAATMTIRATKSMSESNGVSYTAAFKAPPEKTEEEINHVIGVPSNGNTKHNPSTLKQPVSCIGTVKNL
ncbi:hypothetical protein AVEN_44224-1 [Araneus ventricosus]|uniref:Uncharacterized protein n=1 Tax=Araneus ventricosus TaxID=182803 RepID=A0A4Y2N6F3_ARAVE|nr:hypothetical protein AVEN_44224-1 [Araneus ventricosus]